MVQLLHWTPAHSHTSFNRKDVLTNVNSHMLRTSVAHQQEVRMLDMTKRLNDGLCNISLPDDGPVRLETCSSLRLLKHHCDFNEVCAFVGPHCNKYSRSAQNCLIPNFQTCIYMQNVELFREKLSVIMLVFFFLCYSNHETDAYGQWTEFWWTSKSKGCSMSRNS
jgi:hypothetical protein